MGIDNLSLIMSNISLPSPEKRLQKLISFTENDLDIMRSELEEGWKIVQLFVNGSRYVGMIEQNSDSPDSIFIPANKKIKILQSSSL